MSLDILDIEHRILRACETIRALPDPDGKFLYLIHNSMPDVVRETAEGYGYTEAEGPKFRPTPQEVTDCLVALPWARGLARRYWKLIWWRSFGYWLDKQMSFRQIGLQLGRSDEAARRRYKDAMLGIWCRANNFPLPPHLVENKSRRRVASVANKANSTVAWAGCAR